MNILLSPNVYLPMRSGVPLSTHALAQAFVSKGHRVFIVTPRLSQLHPSFEEAHGIEVYRMPFIFPWKLTWEMPRSGIKTFLRQFLIDVLRLARLLVQQQIDVVNTHSLGQNLPYILCVRLYVRRPLIITLHGSEFVRLNAPGYHMKRPLLRHAFKRADRIMTISSCLARQTTDFCPDAGTKILMIHNGINAHEFSRSRPEPSTSPYILSLARLNPLKGHDVLLKAFHTVATREPNITLVIAGDGSQRTRLQALALALGLKERVTFLGEVLGERGRDLLACCEFLVLASWSEGMPLVVLEAMASGKPVVGTRVGGIPEIVSDFTTGRVVPPGDPSALAEAMLYLLSNPSEATMMGERGRSLVRDRHDLDHVSDRYLATYRAVLRCSNGGA